jgi:hypothetical protein
MAKKKVSPSKSKSPTPASATPVSKPKASKPAAPRKKAASKPTKAPAVDDTTSASSVADEAAVSEFSTFDEVKAAAIEALILAIEEAERQLTAAKRATSHEALRSAMLAEIGPGE